MSTKSETKQQYITIEEYLQLEEYAENKHEYLKGSIVEMPGAMYAHNLISSNVIFILRNLLDVSNADYRVLPCDMKIHIPFYNNILYPDVSVHFGEPAFFRGRKDVLTNPKVIFEVLPKSTEAYDRGEKFEKYSSLESIEEYVIVAQNRPFMETFFAQKKEENLWKIDRYYELQDQVHIRSLGIHFPLAEVYKNITFSED